MRKIALANGAFAAEENEASPRAARGPPRWPRRWSPPPRSRATSRRSTPLERPIERRSRRSRSRSTAPTGDFFCRPRAQKTAQFNEAGLDRLPICMAKTHLSLSHDPTLAERADRLHRPGPGHARVHGRRLDRRALRRHADDARPRRDAGRLQRRHRRRGKDCWALLTPTSGGVPRGLEDLGRHPPNAIEVGDADLPRAELLAKHGCASRRATSRSRSAAARSSSSWGSPAVGKSTLVRSLTRLIEPTSGAVDRGRDVPAPVPGHAGAAPHERLDGLPALRAVPPPARRRQRRLRAGGAGSAKAERLARADELLGLVGLAPVPLLPRPAVGRDAAACRPRSGARRRPGGAALRRGLLRPRPADPARHAGRGACASRRGGTRR